MEPSDSADATESSISTSTPADGASSTANNKPNHTDSAIPLRADDDDCACQKGSNSSESTCSLCQRTIPSLAEARGEEARLKEQLEEMKARLAENEKRAAEQAEEAKKWRDQAEELEKALSSKTDEHQSTQRDFAVLNDKFVDEIEKVAELQHAKEMVESELEELSRTLFEEANGMVASEARARHQLELARKHLELELKDSQERLAAETSQLKELKSKMELMIESQPQSKRSSVDPSNRGSVDLAQLFGINKISVPDPVPEEPTTAIAIDGHLLHEFKEFVTLSSSVRLIKIHTLAFMRHCQDEDVEPCLRFGATPRISPRKLTEGICSNTCYIEEATTEQVKEYERMVLAAQQPPSPARNSVSNTSMLWDRLQAQYALYQAPKGGCQTCGRTGPLTHRYRVATSDDWSFIDRFCRDRLVAVCEFYIFIRNIRAGLYASRTIEDLYSESIRLRLQMFYARAGVLPIMLSELGVTSQSIGNMGPSGEWPEGVQVRTDNDDTRSIASDITPVTTPKTERAEPLARRESKEVDESTATPNETTAEEARTQEQESPPSSPEAKQQQSQPESVSSTAATSPTESPKPAGAIEATTP
ncbi:rab guanine nucleotide exchange factor S2 [Lunasporangiospora selenospora]|uniref:Rab guanine nucleotide exchange factor S2 n=1 Tax=Lunasporangiospora selenospora TaxID=979761 RepID=A0A9P6KFM3_9FUNG|nr:rab guanine nucleotide exchange factor S2 [Lunasporangiospora selenospora]